MKRLCCRNPRVGSASGVDNGRAGTLARPFLAAFLVILAPLVAGLDVTAQTISQPAVSLRRNFELHRTVVPGDFNNDGIVDLVADDGIFGPSSMVIALGRGDGTFGAAQEVSCQCEPIAAADFDGDGRLDVLVREMPPPDGEITVLGGNGDGTFRRGGDAGDYHSDVYAATADFDGDGNLDLVLSGHGEPPTGIQVVLGNGDLTFGFDADSRTSVPTGAGSAGVAVADFDEDGRPDIAVANRDDRTVSLVMNKGGLLFTESHLSFDRAPRDVAVADLNGDRRADLIVVADAVVYVFLGQGNGSFLLPVRYDVGVGSVRVDTGDFNHNGLPDVVTVNAAGPRDPCTANATRIATASVLSGRGDGTFAGLSTFALGDLADTAGWVGSAHSLHVADVNGDGRDDIIAGYGDLFVTRTPDPNWPPTVNVGDDAAFAAPASIVLRASVTDPDKDAVTYRWTSSAGHAIPPQRAACVGPLEAGTYTFTVTVDDGQGHQATDSVTYIVGGVQEPPPVSLTIVTPAGNAILSPGAPAEIRFDVSDPGNRVYEFFVWYYPDGSDMRNPVCTNMSETSRTCVWDSPGPAGSRGSLDVIALDSAEEILAFDRVSVSIANAAGPLPSPWISADIGAVGAPGHASFERYEERFTVSGAGKDVWGTVDAFHYVYQRLEGDGQITARVSSIDGVEAWTKMGIMIRRTLDPSSAHHFLLASVSKGLAYQRRPTDGGSSLHTSLGSGTAPVWFRIVRTGGVLDLQMSSDSNPFKTVASATFPEGAAYVGLIAHGHETNRLATATFQWVEVETAAPPPPGDTLPLGWSNHDIGAVGAAGAASAADGTYTVEGSGADVWGTADELHFARTAITGNFEFTARVVSVENLDKWVKAGLMLREHLGAGGRHAFAIATPRTERGVAFQRRPTEGGTSVHTAGAALAPPVWLKLARQGDMVSAYYRKTLTDLWTRIGTQTYTALAATVDVGFSVSSHVDGTLATAVFDTVRIAALEAWESRDIGAVALAGHTGTDPAIVEMEATGADIWGTADAFRYRFVPLDGDGAITARVRLVENAHAWTKVGVMIRETLAANSKHAMAIVSAGKGLAMQYRSATGGASANAGLRPGAAPEWMRLTRAGNTITGYASDDGVNWAALGDVTLSMNSSAFIGLAVTSHDASTLATGVFDDIIVKR